MIKEESIDTGKPSPPSLHDRGEAEERLRIMIDAMPLACFFVDSEFHVIDCNNEAMRMFKVSDKQRFQENFFHFSPEYQLDGSVSITAAYEKIREVFEKGEARFEWVHLSAAGEELPCRVDAKKVLWAGDYRCVIYLRDLRDARKLEKEREQRERLMRAANTVAASLSATAPGLFDYDVWQALKLLGETAEVDRVAVYQMVTEDGIPWYQSAHGWVQGQDYIPPIKAFNKFAPEDIPDLYGKLSARQVVDIAVADLSERDRKSIDKLGMESFLAIPIFVLGEFWGSISFGTYEQRFFGDTEVSVLTIVGQLLSSAFLRNSSTKDLLKTQRDLLAHERLLRTSNRIAKLLLQGDEEDFSKTLEEALKALAVGSKVDSFGLWKNYWDGDVLCAQRIHAWRKDGKKRAGDTEYTIDYQTYIPEWADDEHPREGISRPLSGYSQAMRDLDLLKGAKNLLLGPLFYQGEFWGFAAFVRQFEEQHYTSTQRSILTSGCTMIMSAIERNDLTERIIETQEELLDQTKLLKAANEAAAIILEDAEPDFRGTVRNALSVLGKSMGLGHVYIWMNSYEGDTLYCHLIGEWSRASSGAEKRLHGRRINFEEYFPGWRSPLERDEVIQESGEDIPLSVFHINPSVEKISSLLVVPLHAFGTWWGFIGFDDCNSARTFSDAQIKIIDSIGTMFVSAILRSKISEELVEAEESAARDSLTQLLNRRGFMPRANQVFSEHQREKKNLAVMFFDLDFFKKANDTYGHRFGDEVLVTFADILKNSFRPYDLICRYGGEEFVVLVGDAAPEVLEDITGRVNKALSEVAWPYPEFSCTTSVGIMSGGPTEDDTLEDFIQKSDQALYRAKQTGRNKAVTY